MIYLHWQAKWRWVPRWKFERESCLWYFQIYIGYFEIGVMSTAMAWTKIEVWNDLMQDEKRLSDLVARVREKFQVKAKF